MSGMTVYFTRRLLLVPITFFAITFLVYSVLRVVPGGPIEQAETMMKLAAASSEGGGGGGGTGAESGLQLDEDAIRELEEYYALDRSIPVGYLQWLGLWPRVTKKRVPVVPASKHPGVMEALTEAAAARDEAASRLAEAVGERGWKEWNGRLWQPVPETEVPDDVRVRAEQLRLRVFGDLEPLQTYLAGHDLAWVDGAFARPVGVEIDADVQARLADLTAARARLADVEREKGYYVDDTGSLMQTEFRTMLALHEVREEATQRIRALLVPEDMIAYRGRVYRLLTDAEAKAFADTDLHEDAEKLVAKGFGKRDELLDLLAAQDYTWREGKYYALLKPAERAGREDLLETAESLIGTRLFADEKLRHVEDEHGFEVVQGGRVYRLESKLAGVFQFDFGKSYTYNESVLAVIASKMPVSVTFGLIGYFLTWLVCVPLGVFKAIKHRSLFDSVTSVLVFIGYSIPGFVLCLILLSTVAPQLGLPLGGFKPDNVDQMGFFEGLWGRIRYMIIPVSGYMIGGFASMTILMKNSLLENLGQDYVRTAFAKGLREKRVIFVHALRNSLIPITAGIGHALGLLFAGSFLIEKTCNIDGMGLLGFNSILGRDYPIILGLLVFLVLIQLFGNILSDIIWALIDPRIRFG